MARYRKRSKSLWMMLPVWSVAAILIGWGLWQFAEFRHTLIAQAQQPPAPGDAAPTTSAPATETSPPGVTDRSLIDPPNPSTEPPAPDDALPPPPPLPPPNTKPPENVAALLANGISLLDSGRIVEGRTALNGILATLNDDPRAETLREQLTALNAGIFLGSAILPEDPAARYVNIRPGDSFLKLGHEYNVPAAFLEEINPNLNPRNLKPTTGIKIVRGPFNLRLTKHAARLDLYARDLYVRSFDAQLEDGNYLPRGNYRIKAASKIDLGERKWIGFEGCEPGTREVSLGWIYGSAGMRGGTIDDHVTGLKVEDADLLQLYTVLVENHSLLHVLR